MEFSFSVSGVKKEEEEEEKLPYKKVPKRPYETLEQFLDNRTLSDDSDNVRFKNLF